MFRASICPSSGVLGCVRCIRLHMVFSTVKESGWFHKMKPPTNAQFSFTALNTICSRIQRTQPNTPEDGHVDAQNM
jgi:hypothetical protein